jgi:hypothetical protein
MDVKLEASNDTATWEEGGDGLWTGPPSIMFTSDDKTVEFMAEAGADTDQWTALALACENGLLSCIDWEPGNGDTSITVGKDRIVEFVVGKFGDGCGGHVTLRLKAAGCAAAFHEAAALTKAWMADIRDRKRECK